MFWQTQTCLLRNTQGGEDPAFFPRAFFIRENSTAEGGHPPQHAKTTRQLNRRKTRGWRPARAAGPVCDTSVAKKLRYMSKFAAIFARTDNTHLSCTQPIANLLVARL